MRIISLKYLTAVMTLITGLFVSSCNQDDFFELTNPPEFPWLNVSEYEMAAVSPYNYAFYSGWGGHFYFADVVFRDAMTDLLYHIPGATADYPVNEVYNRQTSVNNISRVSESFSSGYRAIGLANAALDFYYNNNGNPFPSATTQDKNFNLPRIAGELHFMRAFSYFYMTIRHCPVPEDPGFETEEILPLRKSFTDAEGAINAEFVTTRAIYDFIVEDLTKAIELLPTTYLDGVHHPSYRIGRANQHVAKALLARVYFRLGDFSKAEALATEVIEEGPYTLNQDPIEAFNRSDASQGNEVIWQALFYDETLRESPNDVTLFTFLDYRATNGGHGEFFKRSSWHTYSMSNPMAQRLGWMDESLGETESARFDKRYRQLYHRLEGNRDRLGDNPDEYEQQYTHVKEPRIWGDKYFRAANGQYGNVPVIRLAELYLTRAIIRFKNNDMSGAAADLNVVRRRAWDETAAGVAYDDSDAFLTSANITEEMIHQERIKELAFEGDWLLYSQAMGLPLLAGERVGVSEIEAPYSGLYWPVPQSELDFRSNN